MNRDSMLQGVYDSELRRAAAVVATIWQLTLLAQVLIYLHDYQRPAVPIAVWLGMLAAAVWLVPRTRAAGLTRWHAAAAIGVAAVAVLVVGLQRRVTGTVDWSIVGSGWLLALVAVSRPVWEWICGAIAVFTVHAVVALRVLGVTALGLARLASTAYALLVILLVFAAVRPMFRASARIAARRAELHSQSAAKRAAEFAVHEDRWRRLAVLEAEVLPLLRGIAAGRLDPSAAEVREQCRHRAAALRRALLDPADRGEVLAELQSALRDSAGRGVPVELRPVGNPGHAGPQVTRWAVGSVDAFLHALTPPQHVVLTVLASGAHVELYLVFRESAAATHSDRAAALTAVLTGTRGEAAAGGPQRAGPVPHGCDATVEIDDSGSGCLEMRWPKEVRQ